MPLIGGKAREDLPLPHCLYPHTVFFQEKTLLLQDTASSPAMSEEQASKHKQV